MPFAWMLTVVAWLGVVLGALGHSRERSPEVAAGGGGLLVGICFFWLMPEIADESGWVRAVVFVLTAAALLFLIDSLLEQAEHRSRRHVLIPLLTATSLHSMLDGWSIRAVTASRLAGTLAASAGLALHKLPEGVALGFVSHRALKRLTPAILVAALAESFTLLGGWIEPRAAASGIAEFGASWTAVVLAIVAGTFLFLGVHSALPTRDRPGVLWTFMGMFAVAGAVAGVQHVF